MAMTVTDDEIQRELRELGVDERGRFNTPKEGRSRKPKTLVVNSTPTGNSSIVSSLDNCYSINEDDGSYKGGQYDEDDDFIEPDSCVMEGSRDSSFRTTGSRSTTTDPSSSTEPPAVELQPSTEPPAVELQQSNETPAVEFQQSTEPPAVELQQSGENKSVSTSKNRKVDECSVTTNGNRKTLRGTEITIKTKYW